MAVFPTSPSVGTTTIINGMTYAYNSQGAWEIAHTQSDESLVDVGVSTFESQVQFNDTSGTQVLYHFNDNLTDNGPNSITATSANLTYGTGKFGKAAQFNGATDGTNTHVDFTGGGNDIGTGPYTIEFWANVTEFDSGKSSVANGRAEFINSHSDQSTQAGPGYYKITTYGGSLYVNHHDGTAWTQIIGTHGMSVGTWYHIAVSRDSGGTTRVFIGTTGTNTLIATHTGPAISIGDGMYAWTLGRTMNNTAGHGSWGNYHLDGLIDELLITKTAKYTSTFTVPTAPHDDIVTKPPAVAGKALLYAKDVVGGGGDALYNFTSGDPTADDIRTGNAGSIVGAPHTGAQYVTNHDSIGTAWGDQLRVSNVNYQGTPGTPGNLFDIPDHGIGAGSYTVEFFYDPVNVNTSSGQTGIFSIGYSAWNTLLDVSFQKGFTPDQVRVRDVLNIGGTPSERFHYFEYDWSSVGGTWLHWAVCREVDQPTTGDYRITVFVNGVELAVKSGSSNVGTTGIADYNLSTNDYLSMGGYRVSSGAFGRPVEAVYDSVLVTRSCKYPTGSPPNPVPSAPFAPPSNISKLHVMDSTGSEGVIS